LTIFRQFGLLVRQMKKILITGCSGYIGSHLTKLLKGKYEIHGIDKIPPQEPVDKFVQGCIMDENISDALIYDYDAVIHLAALVKVGESEEFPVYYYQTNIFGTLNVLDSISFKHFIFASTGAATTCTSAYGISKRAAEDIVKSRCKLHDVNYTTFRFYNVIGSSGFFPTNPDGLFYNLMQSKETKEFTIYGTDYETPDGTCVRDYVHVDEICNSIEAAIENPSNSTESLGRGVGNSVKQMVEIFQKVNNLSIDIKYGPKRAGDKDICVLDEPSSYMKNLYTIDQLLKI
jgi:UDP-glucose 4-epimerase